MKKEYIQPAIIVEVIETSNLMEGTMVLKDEEANPGFQGAKGDFKEDYHLPSAPSVWDE